MYRSEQKPHHLRSALLWSLLLMIVVSLAFFWAIRLNEYSAVLAVKLAILRKGDTRHRMPELDGLCANINELGLQKPLMRQILPLLNSGDRNERHWTLYVILVLGYSDPSVATAFAEFFNDAKRGDFERAEAADVLMDIDKESALLYNAESTSRMLRARLDAQR